MMNMISTRVISCVERYFSTACSDDDDGAICRNVEFHTSYNTGLNQRTTH